jgi:hypothetical protein
MIKNIFFTVAIIFFAANSTAQICIPDTSLKIPGLKPSTLPDAIEGKPYNESVSVLMFRDTYRIIFGSKVPIKIDSVKVTGVSGLPSGISHQCQYSSCVFLWDTVRCLRISGTASKAGVYPITIYVRAFGKLAGTTPLTQNDSIKTFTLNVNSQTASNGLIEAGVYRLYPNPANQYVTLTGLNVAAKQWFVTDITGRFYNINVVESNRNAVSLSTLNLPVGVYNLSDGESRIRFVLQR